MNITYHGKPTNLFWILSAGITTAGATVTRRQKGYTDYNDIQTLVKAGMLEPKAVGPRGGVRYFTTAKGELELEQVIA